jgi:hypothetical protein
MALDLGHYPRERPQIWAAKGDQNSEQRFAIQITAVVTLGPSKHVSGSGNV